LSSGFFDSFRVEVDINSGSNFSLSDLMCFRKNKSDVEIAITTPDNQTGTKYITRRKLSQIISIRLICPKRQELDWNVNKK
jgi:hypothetical protein